jgi:hypothetical protein
MIEGEFDTLHVLFNPTCDITFSRDTSNGQTIITSTGMLKLEKNKGVLEIKGVNDIKSKETYVYPTQFNSAFCDGSRQCSAYGMNSVSVSDRNFTITSDKSHLDLSVSFNGKPAYIVLESEMKTRVENVEKFNPDVHSYSNKWILINKIQFKTVVSTATVNTTFKDPTILDDVLTIKTCNAGSIYVVAPKHFLTVDAYVIGSGSIDFGGSLMEEFMSSISSCGNITGFYATKFAHPSIFSSGNIVGECSSTCVINKEQSGTGRIFLTKS